MVFGARTVVKTASGLMYGWIHRRICTLAYGLLCSLLFTLLFAQTLGVMHRTLHSPFAHSNSADRAAHVQNDPVDAPNTQHVLLNLAQGDNQENDHDGHDHHHAHVHAPHAEPHTTWLTQLFAHTDGEDACRLMDCTALADSINSAVATVNIAPAALFLIVCSQVAATARASELFQARGPPTAR